MVIVHHRTRANQSFKGYNYVSVDNDDEHDDDQIVTIMIIMIITMVIVYHHFNTMIVLTKVSKAALRSSLVTSRSNQWPYKNSIFLPACTFFIGHFQFGNFLLVYSVGG